MGISENVKSLIARQHELTKDMEAVMKQLDTDNPVLENEKLKAELIRINQQADKLENEFKVVKKENSNLRIALNEQLLNERLSILKASKEKIDAYFRLEEKSIDNKLALLEKRSMERLSHIRKAAEKELVDNKTEISKEIDQIEKLAAQKIADTREWLLNQSKEEKQKLNKEYNELQQAPISPEVVQKRLKQNSVEVKIGLSWINRIGIILILLGVASAARYTYANWFNEYMKGAFIFILGFVFVSVGELMSRKNKTVFSIGMNAGGTAILYYGVFSGYFFLNILDLMPAMLISIALTALTIYFSLRYDSQTINGFALFGGYLPFFSYVFYFGLDGSAVFAAMAYIFILNFSLLYISSIKGWRIIKYMSFLLNVPVLIYLVEESSIYAVDIAYSLATFALYTAIILVGALNYKTKLNVIDMILLGLNTFISCIVTYMLLLDAGLKDYKGLLAAFFCLVYFSLGRLVNKKLGENRAVKLLFYMTSLLFALLFVPFQLSFKWIVVGWSIEALVMIIYGVYRKSRMLEYTGWIALILANYIFYGKALLIGIQDILTDSPSNHIDYAAIIGSMVLLLYFYTKNIKKGITVIDVFERNWLFGFKSLVIICSWIYLLNESQFILNNAMKDSNYLSFYSIIVFAGITAGTAYVITRLKPIRDKWMEYMSIGMYVIAALVSIYANISAPVLYAGGSETGSMISLIVLVAYNILSLLIMKDSIHWMIKEHKGNIEYYPIVVSVFLLINTTFFMTSQIKLSNINFLISFVYIVLAFAFIFYGFKYRYAYIRRLGLALCIFSSAKLFIIDLAYLDLLWKIAAYFGFGLVMLGISYIYQKLRTLMDDNITNSIEKKTSQEL
jgi:uncharacterized membrane protein